jgi:rubrerythrin
MTGLVDDPMARGLFELLAAEERQHKYRVESTLEKAVYKAF